MPSCDLSIVIVSWNVADLLLACLRSIEACSDPCELTLRRFGPPTDPLTLEVVVVDNASGDDTVARVHAAQPWVRVVEAGRNRGFTGGNNLGFAESRGRFVYFLNPDTELVDQTARGDSLWTLCRLLQQDETIGMVGPALRYGDGTWQNSRRRFPTPLTGFLESTWLGRCFPHNRWARRLVMDDLPADQTHEVDWLVGAAMMARRTALDAVRMPGVVGPFDEGFFMYSEEVDLGKRLKDAGWRILYVPAAAIVHHEGRSSEQVVAARHIHFNTSKVRYYRKQFGRGWAELLRRYLLLEFRTQLWVERGKLLLGHRRDLRSARIAAYRAVLASRLLPPDRG